MQVTQPSGRRERNKQVKLERIVAAARELFAEQGVDEVTTQQIAERADIGAGTLFLYVKNKGELLLLVQNEHYREALELGRRAAADARTLVDAVVALVEPVVACNRVQVENGRTYLREMAFGDPGEPNHAEALTISGETERTVAGLIAEHGGVDEDRAATLAHVVSAVLFVTMVSSADPDTRVAEVVATIRTQVGAVLPS
ncbi:TetR/AcrR family transcriptional regulator [Curtobacterium flaccumfaciens]|uniref:TetR/AcrR family transcriptional regulator n=1 Tax=Curtobacterium flaccumfaciens TaxID=2035 RepID=UPI001BE01CFE|nr:TetR/AcrR family transcriptional regulator [Curtobacterium flaccumfaciens]MBT1582848.1 TetR/AcrR family transcriptional regulator [Curtobacterium flaccumfaciens pv. flaccumfaciens]MCX2797919.1 helix-turn-helix domain containing protein [Curtobacterium flaccumfaciens pv. flaccumfaciens]